MLLIPLAVVAIIYGVLFFFDSFFKSCMHHPYSAFLDGTGLTIRFLRLDWYTTAFNRQIRQWSSRTRLLSRSFDLGVYSCLLLAPLSFFYLLHTVFHTLRPPVASSSTTITRPMEVEILIPGVTLPQDELSFYLITLLICTVLHELGHAMASYVEDVPLNGVGLRLLFIIPMAYADLSSDLERVKVWSKLRIFCAGVWHNLLCGLLSYLLFLSLPHLLAPLYTHSSAGLYVLQVADNSPVGGARGLHEGDVVVQINQRAVTGQDSYYDALLVSLRDKPRYCVTSDYVHTHDESKQMETLSGGGVECCDRKDTANLCFEHFIVNGVLEMPPFMCLHVRRMIEHSGGPCDDQENCNPGYYCIKPMLDNRTTILQIRRARDVEVLYLGSPGDLYRTIKWSAYVPKSKYVSPQLAENVTLLLKYLTVFSFGLAFVNVLPCYGFDGQYIVQIMLQQLLAKVVRNRRKRDGIAMVVTAGGTVMLLLLVLDFARKNLVMGF